MNASPQEPSTSDGWPQPFGRFLMLQPLQPGGMATVTVAYDGTAKQIVALKRLPPFKRQDRDSLARFRDEIRISLQLDHPHLVRALDWGETDGEVWLALEWIAGQDARAMLERASRADVSVPVPVAVAIVLQVCDAFAYAHGRPGLNFVHRDVSLSNVVVGYDGAVRLVDYGLALSVAKSSETAPGVVFGTHGYISPEQRDGKVADRRSDLYALGTVLWSLVTGAPPATRGEDDESKQDLLETFGRFRGDAPPAIAEVIWRALQADPSRRYQSAAELAEALRACGSGADQATVAAFVGKLFSGERARAEQDLKSWSQRYELRSPAPRKKPESTAVMRPVRDDDAQPRSPRRDTVVIGAVDQRKRLALIIGVGTASAILISIVVIAFASHPGETHPPRMNPPPATLPAPPVHVTPLAPPNRPEIHVAVEPVTPPRHVEPVTPRHVEPVTPRHDVEPPPAPAARPWAKQIERARAAFRAGEVTTARKLLSELQLDEAAAPQATLAMAELELHQGNYADAIRLASEAHRLGAGVEAVYVRASAEMDAREFEKAARDFKQVLAVSPNHPDAREGLNAAEQQLRRPEQ